MDKLLSITFGQLSRKILQASVSCHSRSPPSSCKLCLRTAVDGDWLNAPFVSQPSSRLWLGQKWNGLDISFTALLMNIGTSWLTQTNNQLSLSLQVNERASLEVFSVTCQHLYPTTLPLSFTATAWSLLPIAFGSGKK